MCKFAFTSYEKILTEFRSCLRGLQFDEHVFLNHVKVIDELIIDMCPLADKYSKKYDSKFCDQGLNQFHLR